MKNAKSYKYWGSQEEFYELVEEIKNYEGFISASHFDKTFSVEEYIDGFAIVPEQFHKDIYQLI